MDAFCACVAGRGRSCLRGRFGPGAVAAQVADRCLAVSRAPSLVQPASIRLASLSPAEVRLTFVGHATWLIESPGGVKDRHRLQRLHPAPGGARYRHHEPGAHHALLDSPRSRHQARPARLEPRGRAGQARSDLRRRARAQRRHQHPRLGRRRDPLRQLDLHLRGRRHVHRPSRPPASHADRAADRPDRPARRGHGAGRRQLHHGCRPAWSRCSSPCARA